MGSTRHLHIKARRCWLPELTKTIRERRESWAARFHIELPAQPCAQKWVGLLVRFAIKRGREKAKAQRGRIKMLEIVVLAFMAVVAGISYAIPPATLVLVILVYSKVNRIEWLLSKRSSAETRQMNDPSSAGESRP